MKVGIKTVPIRSALSWTAAIILSVKENKYVLLTFEERSALARTLEPYASEYYVEKILIHAYKVDHDVRGYTYDGSLAPPTYWHGGEDVFVNATLCDYFSNALEKYIEKEKRESDIIRAPSWNAYVALQKLTVAQRGPMALTALIKKVEG